MHNCEVSNFNFCKPLPEIAIHIAILSALTIPAAAESVDSWMVDTEQGMCVIEHISKYINQKFDPVIIVLSLCPNSDQELAMDTDLENSGLPQPKIQENTIRDIIVMNRSDLKCLKSIKMETSGENMMIPKRPCE